MTKQQIGKVLKSLRLKANMTQKEVATLIGRSQQIVGHWETGYSQPDADTLFALCDLYGASVDEAFGYTKKSPAPAKSEAREKDIFADELMKNYKALNQEGKRRLVDYSKDLVSGGRYAALNEDVG